MEIMHERVAGLDVRKAMIAGCVRIMASGGIERECQTFGTTTAGLEALLAWLTASGCTHVAMEAAGVYWKPVWNILSDGAFDLIVANAAHIKNVPGRKTDVNDAMWIADLAACGLVKASFVPEEAIQDLRSMLRARKQLTRKQTSHVQRIQKALEEASIKLDPVITDIVGVSGRRMIEAMIAGVKNPARLAERADRRIKASPKALYDALHGRLTPYHRFMLQLHLEQYDALSKAIARIGEAADAAITRMDEAEEAGHRASFRPLIILLCSVPGISILAATVILAETGRDMSRFATPGHLLAWATGHAREGGMCPGQHESAGKRKSSRLRKGAPWLKTILVPCAWAATRKKDSCYGAQFRRLRAKRGPKKAICAVAASMLTAIYHMLKNGTQHQDLGAGHFDRRSSEAKARHHVAQLARLGFHVELQPVAQAA